MDKIDKGKDQMGAVERAFAGLPGIKGYKEKEMRREADKRLRDTLAQRLDDQRRRLTSLQHELLSAGGLLWMDDLERAVGRLQLLSDRVRTAAYGYAPFFDLERIREEELDRLVAFDQQMFEMLPRLEETVAQLESAVRANEQIKEAIGPVADLLAEMNETFGRREEAIQAAR